MAWIKRNLFLVVGAVCSLGLLGVAGYFLYTKYEANVAITEELDGNITNLKNLTTRDPHPGTAEVDNISAAKEEAKKLKEFLGEMKQFFPVQIKEPLDSRGFRAMLDTVISGLQKGAEASGVKLPENYWFTFSSQKTAIQFPTNILTTLGTQLLEVRELCNVLYDAKVVALDSIRRAPIATEDTDWQDFLSEQKGKTNEFAVLMPYEVTFRGFSSEIARVLEGLIRTTNACFVVKNVGINRADAAPEPMFGMPMMGGGGAEGGAANPYSRYGGMMRGAGSDAGSASRYGGMGGRYGGMDMSRYGIPNPSVRAPQQQNLRGSVLDEKLLKVTLILESVRLLKDAQPDMPAEE